MALAAAMMSVVAMGALGMALAVLVAAETRIAGLYRDGVEAAYAAEAALAAAWRETVESPNLEDALAGLATSARVDGGPGGVRQTLAGPLDLDRETNILRCGRTSPCAAWEVAAVTRERPWGDGNPVWRPYAYGLAHAMVDLAPDAADGYVVVWIANGAVPEAFRLRAQAYAGSGVSRAAEALALRDGRRVVSWRAGL